MKVLYFTRLNGDVDNIPEKSVNDFDLTSKAKRRKFIGDSGSDNFSLQEPVLHAVWDGEKYISDAVKIKAESKQALREERDGKLNASTVTYDGSEFQTRPSDFINFTTMLTLLQNDTDSIVWTLADDSEKTITKADLQAVYLLGLQAGAMIDKEYRDAVRAL